MRMRLVPVVTLLVLAMFMSGCAGGPRQAAVDPLQIMAWHGQANALSAKLILKTTLPNADPQSVTVYFYHDADGRVRLLITKLDVDLVSVWVEADGSFVAFAPRSGLRTVGELADPQLPRAFADLRLVLSELSDGPASPQLNLRSGDEPGILLGASGPYQARLTVAANGEEVLTKTLTDGDGTVAYQITYRRYRIFDGLHRPQVVESLTADGSRLLANLITFETQGGISAERMRVRIPDTALAVSLTDFLEHVDG